MFQKILFTLLIVFIFNVQSFSQGFQKSAGLSAYFIKEQQQRFMVEPFQRTPYEVLTPKEAPDWVIVGHFNPRVLLYKNDSSMIAVNFSVPMSIGGSFQVSTNGANSASLIASVPLLVEFAYGLSAFEGSATSSNFGAFVAAGYNFNLAAGDLAQNFNSFNPHTRAGIRFKTENRIFEVAYFQDILGIYDRQPDDQIVYYGNAYLLAVPKRKWIQGITISYIF